MLDIEAQILSCLKEIENVLSSDQYEYAGPFTIGGAMGNYYLKSPFNTEAEYTLVNASVVGNIVSNNINTVTLLTQASSAQTVSGSSADISVTPYTEIAFDANITAVAGTSPTLVFNIDRKDPDGIYYSIFQSASITAIGAVTTSIGDGMTTGQSLGSTIRLRWTIGGTTPSFTFSANIIAKQSANIASGNAAYFTFGPRNPRQPTLSASGGDVFGAITQGTDNIVSPEMIVGALTEQTPNIPYNLPWTVLSDPYVYANIQPMPSAEILLTIYFRRKLLRIIPDKPKTGPQTQRAPQSRRMQTLPAESPMTAGMRQRHQLGTKPYQHTNGGPYIAR